MNILGPTGHRRLNEAMAIVYLLAGLGAILCLVSYHPSDPSMNTSSGPGRPINLIGRPGALFADFWLQALGLVAFAIPAGFFALAWKWLHSTAIHAQWARAGGALGLVLSSCAFLGLGPDWKTFGNAIHPGGIGGMLLAEKMLWELNTAGAWIVTAGVWIVSLYLVSTFEVAILRKWFARPIAIWGRFAGAWRAWTARRAEIAKARADEHLERVRRRLEGENVPADPLIEPTPEPALTGRMRRARAASAGIESPAIVETPSAEPPLPAIIPDIPIRPLEAEPPAAAQHESKPEKKPEPRSKTASARFLLPPTDLLNEPSGRSPYDSDELKEIAAKIKSKFEEFNVLGSVVQINPGPVVTTFEFKPEAGVKYSRITTLSEDLCLGLQAESILIERIPGKPTVGIEVPNSKRELISLRAILESDEFHQSGSPLTVALGKDINGRIRVAALDSMPHLLIAGSTGSGKSVMLNSLIMSILYKATPQQVRMILVDPKRLEFGLYEGIPHLLVPVITDPKKATIALRNAVLEMERRLKLLASHGVRNIDQYNRKIRQLLDEPRSLFTDGEDAEEEPELLPYILLVIDELADLMMVERANVEETVTRLAQMARAVGMHLVLATQRPSVDVITGLIKANFPSRISFRVATRVDSRTVLDVMGAEHLLGKGDMLFLPPGSSRLTRVHGAFVTEPETNRVVEFWKQQATPEYDKTFLIAPPEDDEPETEAYNGEEDPLYQDAVRVVLEMGKASTSILQRRLRLGYGRAARILDVMQREGIIGAPDGSRPREVLKRPDWLEEVGAR